MTTTCPSRHELERYALGQTSPAESERLDGHLRACRACLAALKALPASGEGAASATPSGASGEETTAPRWPGEPGGR
jgi:hypothetical protein